MKYGLGKGMMALVDENEIINNNKNQIKYLNVDDILPNRYQPRKNFKEDTLKELADSIKEKGIIQPIIVTEIGGGKYELVAGERRLRASKLAGLKEIPAIIQNFNEEDRIEIALIENLQRDDLNPIEEALAFKEIMEKFNYTQEEVAKKIGKNRTTITNILRLLKLPDYTKEKLISGELTEGHARSLLSIEDETLIIELTNKIINENLSVRQVENLVKNYKSEDKTNKDTDNNNVSTNDPIINQLEEAFIRSLGAKVEIKGNNNKGKIYIHYNSKEELENIYKKLSN